MGSRWSASIPIFTVAVIAVLVLGVGAPQAVRSARVWGGPTESLARYSGWISADSDGAPLAGARLALQARSFAGTEARAEVLLDQEGRAEFILDFGRPPRSFELEVRERGRLLALGRVVLSTRDWSQGATHRGGFWGPQSQGVLSLELAPGRGAFAVPFAGPLWVRVRRAGQAVAGAKIILKSDGAKLIPESSVSDRQGLAKVILTPLEHAVMLQVRAVAEGTQAELSAAVPVVPGAMIAERDGSVLRVTSPVERSSAFVRIVSATGRLRGARIGLSSLSNGPATGVFGLPELPDEPLWAVLSSSPEGKPGAVVGWPLFAGNEEPPLTFDVSDRLSLDGRRAAEAAEHQRRLRVRRGALLIGLLGASLSIFRVLQQAARSRRDLSLHLSSELGEPVAAGIAPPNPGRSLLVIGLIAAGFLLIAALVAWRLL